MFGAGLAVSIAKLAQSQSNILRLIQICDTVGRIGNLFEKSRKKKIRGILILTSQIFQISQKNVTYYLNYPLEPATKPNLEEIVFVCHLQTLLVKMHNLSSNYDRN